MEATAFMRAPAWIRPSISIFRFSSCRRLLLVKPDSMRDDVMGLPAHRLYDSMSCSARGPRLAVEQLKHGGLETSQQLADLGRRR
jgi:hypothetical protein